MLGQPSSPLHSHRLRLLPVGAGTTGIVSRGCHPTATMAAVSGNFGTAPALAGDALRLTRRLGHAFAACGPAAGQPILTSRRDRLAGWLVGGSRRPRWLARDLGCVAVTQLGARGDMTTATTIARRNTSIVAISAARSAPGRSAGMADDHSNILGAIIRHWRKQNAKS